LSHHDFIEARFWKKVHRFPIFFQKAKLLRKMECRIESRKSISREPETRRWFPEPGKKEPRTNINRTAKRLFFFTLVLNIILVLKYNLKTSAGSPYLFVISLENTSAIAGAGQAKFPEAVHFHFAGLQKKFTGTGFLAALFSLFW